MGRGDRKTRKGKIFRGSHGVVRPKKSAVPVIIPKKKKVVAEKVMEEKTPVAKKKVATKKKAPAKKQ